LFPPDVIFEFQCTKFNFDCGSAPDPTGSLQRSPDTLAAFQGSYFYGKGGRKENTGGRREEKQETLKEKEKKREGDEVPNTHFWLHH